MNRESNNRSYTPYTILQIQAALGRAPSYESVRAQLDQQWEGMCEALAGSPQALLMLDQIASGRCPNPREHRSIRGLLADMARIVQSETLLRVVGTANAVVESAPFDENIDTSEEDDQSDNIPF